MNANKTVLRSDLGNIEAHTLTADELDEIPELTDADMAHGQWRVGGQAVGEAEGRAVFRSALKKQKINITLDPDVVSWFKAQAGGRGYQTLINATLREAMQKKTLADVVRETIREELHHS